MQNKRKPLQLVSLLLLALFAHTVAMSGERSEVGVVVIHGKWDSPNGHSMGLANYLSREGFPVATPEMPWSGKRQYDKGVDGMLAELDKATEELRAKGAKKIVLVGHSQGAAAGLNYASQRSVNGVVLIAAGGHPQSKVFMPHYQASVSEAKTLVAQGKGDTMVSFSDLNTGNRSRSMRCSARIFLDYFDPEGPFNTFDNAQKIKPGTAVLVIIPSRESEGLKTMADTIMKKIPGEAKASRTEVDADHLGAPDAAKSAIRDWLLAL
jgi:pimeloyl-ACP methyl ester carboxylesterase